MVGYNHDLVARKMTKLASIGKNHQKESAELSRVAALTVSQMILVQSLGSFFRSCVRETYASLSNTKLFSTRSAVNLDTFVQALAQNTDKLVRELERELMLWLVGKTTHPMRQKTSDQWTLMDSEASDMEVLKARMENQLNEYVRFEISDFQQRWKKVLAEKFDPESGVMTPIYQGLFIVEFLRGKNFPAEITDDLVQRFVQGFPAECKKIHIELCEAFQAMGLKSGGWEVYNGAQRMCPTQQI